MDDRRASGPDAHRPGATFFTVPGSLSSAKKKVPLSDQTLEDVEARLHGLDLYGVATQVIFPTMFLVSAVEDVRLEAAVDHAYNQYVSEACSRSSGRLKWAALIPWRDAQAALEDLQWASDRGAAGLFYRDPIEWLREGRAFVTFETDEDIM